MVIDAISCLEFYHLGNGGESMKIVSFGIATWSFVHNCADQTLSIARPFCFIAVILLTRSSPHIESHVSNVDHKSDIRLVRKSSTPFLVMIFVMISGH